MALSFPCSAGQITSDDLNELAGVAVPTSEAAPEPAEQSSGTKRKLPMTEDLASTSPEAPAALAENPAEMPPSAPAAAEDPAADAEIAIGAEDDSGFTFTRTGRKKRRASSSRGTLLCVGAEGAVKSSNSPVLAAAGADQANREASSSSSSAGATPSKVAAVPLPIASGAENNPAPQLVKAAAALKPKGPSSRMQGPTKVKSTRMR